VSACTVFRAVGSPLLMVFHFIFRIGAPFCDIDHERNPLVRRACDLYRFFLTARIHPHKATHGQGEVTSQHHHRGQQTLLHEVFEGCEVWARTVLQHRSRERPSRTVRSAPPGATACCSPKQRQRPHKYEKIHYTHRYTHTYIHFSLSLFLYLLLPALPHPVPQLIVHINMVTGQV